jgi:agmatinase
MLDCGDIPITPFDNALAERQMTAAYQELLTRTPVTPGLARPKLLTLGGDHSVALPALRALHEVYGPITVVHFDAHLDTWIPAKYPSAWMSSADGADDQSAFNHGSMFWLAGRQGLLARNGSVHAGLRTRLSGTDAADYADDGAQGWARMSADAIDEVGTAGVIDFILSTVGTEVPVYLSLDIDVVDPGLAPGTGTPEPGGWTSREVIRILRGIEGLNVVGADVVEVAPAYDGTGEQTSLMGAQVVYEMLTSMVLRGIADGMVAAEKPGQPPVKDEL